MLISSAVDHALQRLKLGIPRGAKIWVEEKYFDGFDQKYAVAAIRDYLLRRGGQLVELVGHGRQLAVLFIDLDRFKNVNDTLGHDAGDRLLQAVANRLVRVMRTTDTVARLAGDEFAVLLEGVDTVADLDRPAAALVETLGNPIVLGDSEVRVSTSIGVALFPSLAPVVVPGWRAGPTDLGWQHAFAAWERFDALWFLRIADGGYRLEDGSAAFFPLYPLTIRGVSFVLGGAPLAAATLVSNAAFLAALFVTYLLTTAELSERTARTTVVLLCVFPASHFFLMPYSESLFLLLAGAAFWGARRGRWALAGVSAMLAALTRSIGVILLPALAVEAIERRSRGVGPAWPGLLAAGGASLGTFVYLAWWQLESGDWLTPITRQQNWQREFSWPWTTLLEGTRVAFRFVGQFPAGYHLLDWLLVVVILAAAVWVVWRCPLPYSTWERQTTAVFESMASRMSPGPA